VCMCVDNNFQTKLPSALIEFVGLLVVHVIGLIVHVLGRSCVQVDFTLFLVKNFLPEGYTLLSVTVPVYLLSGC